VLLLLLSHSQPPLPFSLKGTLNHMAPELLLHGHASRASDVYAYGILLVSTGSRCQQHAACKKCDTACGLKTSQLRSFT